MAEATIFRNNALPYPVYGQTWTIVFPLLDADGDPVSPSSPDSERSLNGDTFADCTNEATEIATSTGVCYLTLTAAEMTADIVAVRIQSTGAKTTIVTLYPRKLVVLSTGTTQGGNDTGDIQLAAGEPAIDDYYNGCLVVAVIDSTTEARIINDYVGSTKVAEISPAWNTAIPDANDTYTIYLPEGRQIPQADVKAWTGTAVASPHTAGYPVVTVKDGTGTGEINTNAGAIALVDLVTTTSTATAVTTVNGIAAGAITAAAIANGAIDAATFAADVDAEILSYLVDDATRIDASQLNTHTAITVAGIADGVWDEDATGHQTGGTFGQAIGDPGADTTTMYQAVVTDAAGATIAADIIDIEGKVDDLESRLGTPSDLGGGATVAANLVDIEGQTDDLAAFITRLTGLVMAQGTIGSTGNSTTALHLDGLTYGDDELNDYLLVIRDVSESEYHARWIADWDLSDELATVATLPFTPQNATDTYWLLPIRRDVTAEATVDLAAFFTSDSGETYASAVAGSVVKEIADNAGGASLTVQDIVDGILDEDMTGHQTQGTLGQAIGDPAADANTIYAAVVTGAAGATIAADIIAVKAETATILADTNELQTDDYPTTLATLATAAELAKVPKSDSNVTWNATALASIQTEANDALVANNLDHLVLSAVDTNFATTVHANSVIGHLADNGAGFDRTTDSLEAIRDRGDAAWITATGFSTHSAADVWAAGTRTLTAIDEDTTTLDLDATIRAAVGLATANLDTQIGDLPTNAELATSQASADDATLAAIAALNNVSTAQVQTAAAAALTAYDPPTNAEMEARTLVAASYAAVGSAMTLTGDERNSVADALLDRASAVDGKTPRETFQIVAAICAGEVSGAGTGSEVFVGLDGSTTRVTVTVDEDGNRSAVVYG
jgi:hypothetical protein